MELSGMEIGLRSLLNAAPDATVVVDALGTVVAMNQKLDLLFGWAEADLVGRPMSHLIPARFQRVLEAPAREANPSPAGLSGGSRVSLLARRRDGTEFPVEISRCPLGPSADALMLVAIRDLTEWRRAQDALYREKEQAVVTLESIADAVLTTDNVGRILYLNPMAERLTGWRTGEAAGLPAATILTFISDTSREPVEGTVARCLAEGRAVDLADGIVLLRRDGTEVSVSDSAAPIRDRNGVLTGVVMVFHDVTEKRRATRELTYEAAHDALTGLFNRTEFERRLARLVSDSTEGGQGEHALCYMDLDGFKIVNDTCGHEAGDELLRRIAAELGKQMRKRDTLARLGGDEFGVLLDHCALSEAGEVARKLHQAVGNHRFVWGEQEFTVGISIGVVPINATTGRTAAVLRAADAACYLAKESGGGHVHVDWPVEAGGELQRAESRRTPRLVRALHEGKFHLYVQAIVPLAPERSARPRCEILVRLPDDRGGLHAASSFLPQAARYNLMPAIDRWVVRKAIELLGAWHEQHAECQLPLCSINLSNASLNDETLIPTLREHLTRCQLPAEALCFEITESGVLSTFPQTIRFLADLRATGCGIALDDFGNGVNSFAYLKALSVDYVKIGGHYVRGVVDDPVYATIVEAVSQIGKHMGITTIAGAVESEPVLSRLRALGIPYAQGNAVAPPVPLTDADGSARMPCVRLSA